MPRRVALLLALATLAVPLAGCAGSAAPAAPSTPAAPEPAASSPAPAPAPAPTPTPTFDRAARSTDDPASIWVVVNKTRPVNPVEFTPPDLVVVPVRHTWE